MTKNFCTAIALLAAVVYGGTATGSAAEQAAAASIEELWQDRDITSLDLRWGSGGKGGAPSPDVEYEFKGVDDTGNSGGYDVVGPDGKEWRVKYGIEAQPEMVASRVIWAVGNWDTKESQNRIYTREGQPGRWFVVQDLGAALGKSRPVGGSRSNIEDFESQKLVLGLENGRVKFDYRGRHAGLLADITPADVLWACERLNRISNGQWVDAFASAAYPPNVADRFIKKIKAKTQEGLALGPRPTSNQ